MLNDWQKVVLRTYNAGQYEYLFDEVTSHREAETVLRGVNDCLFTYLMTEVSDKENCYSKEDALIRFAGAAKDINDIRTALGAWKEDDA